MLLTLGDSFTYGDELRDRHSDAWPQQLASLLDYQLINLGKPSNSNPAICRQLLEYFSQKHNRVPDLVVIGWASPGRTEHSDAGGNYNLWPGYSGNLFKQSHPWREDLLQYINCYHNDQYLFEIYVNQLIYTQSFLHSKNVKYLMLNAVGNEYYHNLYRDSFKSYYDLLDLEKIIGWPNEGMLEWADHTKKGPNGHFLEEGHLIVANKIYEHIRNIGWIS